MRFKFWYISLPSSAKQHEMTKFKVLWKTLAQDHNFFIFFLNLNAVPTSCSWIVQPHCTI